MTVASWVLKPKKRGAASQLHQNVPVNAVLVVFKRLSPRTIVAAVQAIHLGILGQVAVACHRPMLVKFVVAAAVLLHYKILALVTAVTLE